MYRATMAIALLIGTVGFALADVKSGPEVGAKVAALKVFVATGALESKELDIVGERKDKATVYVFIPREKFDRPMARYLKALDKELAGGKEKAEIIAVWLTDQIEPTKEHLPKIQQSLQMEATSLAVFTGEKGSPKDWHINDMAHLTTVVVVQGKVAATAAYQSINETDAQGIVKALRKVVGQK